MQSVPANWGSIFSASHKTEYRFTVNGVNYEGDDLKDTPVIVKPLLDKPAIGRCCTGQAKFKIYPKGTIPKAATVDAYCRLRSATGNAVTNWIPQGKFYISNRKGKDLLEITCLDRMIKAGVTYRDKCAFNSWPQPMTAVVNDICRVMGISLDARTTINTGAGYTVDYPNDDVLISEILGMIGAAHGGNWIITEAGKLRLVVLTAPAGDAVQILGKAHTGFVERGKVQTISRVILVDDAENEFTAGDDSGLTISAKCNYATQAIAAALCSTGGIPIDNGCLTIPDATYSKGVISVGVGTVANGKIDLQTASVLYGVTFEPYTLSGAYLNPAIELGDTLSVTDRAGTIHRVVVFSVNMNCTVSCTCSLSALIDGETEDEYPYMTMQELTLQRTVRTNQTYFGNRINRSEGFVSELLVNDVVTARMTANASKFSMQSKEGNSWIDRIYFDNLTGKYVITGDVTVQGIATFANSLATSGSTVINGGNITTGQIKSNNGSGFTIDLTRGTISVGNKDLNTALNAIDNEIAISATAQMFTKASGASSYSPASITLTAVSTNTLASYQWYKNGSAMSGKTAQTLTISPSDVSGTSATFKVVGTDSNGKTYTDVMSIAKLADGADGSPGTPGAPGSPGQDSYTAILSNEYIEIPVDVQRKPLEAKTYSCVVSVYKGLTAMTATKNTPTTGQFKVTPGTAPAGVTVAQSTAGTITLTVARNTAIIDASELALTITVYGGITVNAKIAIHANMNDVTVTQQSSIEQNATNITLKVSKDSIISEINQSAEQITISASKLNLTGYITATDVGNSGSTVISGSRITTGTIDASKVTVTNLNASNITSGTINAADVTITNLNASNITSGNLSATRISGGTLDCSKITVSNLSAGSITSGTLSASRISGGTLDCSVITVSNLSASSITSGNLNASRISGGTLNCSNITVSNLSASDIKTGTLDCSKVTVSNLSASSITTGNLNASRISGGTLNCSNITVSNLSASSITSGTLDCNKVSVTNLDVSNAHIQTVYAYSSNYYVALKTTGTTTMYIGSDGSWGSMEYIYLYASTSFQIGTYGASTLNARLAFYTSDRVVRAQSSSYKWDLGTSSIPFNNVYATKLYVNGSEVTGGTPVVDKISYSSSVYVSLNASKQLNPQASTTSQYSIQYSLGSSTYAWGDLYVFQAHLGTSTSSKIGFFGTTPIAKQTVNKVSTSATASTIATKLNELLTALKNYGLITSS